jgi:hypothetical protein
MEMDMEEVSCCHCGKFYVPDPRQKNPTHCRESACQRARKAEWQRKKMHSDPVYKADQKRCQEEWNKSHPDYWKSYRQKHPDQVDHNRDLQMVRDRRRRKRFIQGGIPPDRGTGASLLAKMDSLKSPESSVRAKFSGQFWLVPVLAKMDSLKVNIYMITDS